MPLLSLLNFTQILDLPCPISRSLKVESFKTFLMNYLLPNNLKKDW